MYYQTFMYFLVDPLGLEPRLTEPESGGLPITPYPKGRRLEDN